MPAQPTRRILDRVPLDRATENQPSAPVALFSNAKPPAEDHGPTIQHALLDAILTLDPPRTCRFQTWWGSLMLPVYRGESAHSDGSLSMTPDLYRLWASASRLCRATDARWVIPAATVPWLLGTNDRIYLGVISSLPVSLHEPLHQAMKNHPWHIGMMTVDPTDTLHHRVYSLIPGWHYNQGWVHDTSENPHPREWFRDLPVAGFGPGPGPLEATNDRIPWNPATAINDANPRTYQEALTTQLAAYSEFERPLAFTTGRQHPRVDDLRGKLHDYALNPTHPKGAAKAAFFRTALGLEQQHWRLLAVQLICALTASNPAAFRDEPHGQRQHLRFEITEPVLGLNGRTSMVTSAWKIEDDGPVQLVTLTPGKKRQSLERDEPAGGWAALYAIAVNLAEQARRNCRPTPLAAMPISGSAPTARRMAGQGVQRRRDHLPVS